MPAYKDKKRNTWFCSFHYTNSMGEKKNKMKRGFLTKKEALKWKEKFLDKVNNSNEMFMVDFFDCYTQDVKNRVRLNTWIHKEKIVMSKILPFFGHMKLCDILPIHVVKWQNKLLAEGGEQGEYSQTYLRSMNSQLSALFNHAVLYYGLKENPVRKTKPFGKKHSEEMKFWIEDEFYAFVKVIENNAYSYIMFNILYWCGLRLGELLALTLEDIDLERQIIDVNKSYQRINQADIITPPKTAKGKRKVYMPNFLVEDIRLFLCRVYGLDRNERVFPYTKSFLHKEMERGTKGSGVKRIRIHDLRHSHVSLLIEKGFSALDIAERMGHESIDITFKYAHIFPSKQKIMANRLETDYGSKL